MTKKFPINTRVLVKTTDTKDFYIMKTAKTWYVEMYPAGVTDGTLKTMAGFTTLTKAKSVVENWASKF
jgi:hypothetical protein